MKIIEIPDIIGAAVLVIHGDYGNGDDRKNALEDEGYDYRRVQDCVNDLLDLMNKYGD